MTQRHLTITYRDQTIFDGPVDEFAYQDSDESITVSGRIKPPAKPVTGGGLFEMLTSARRQQTQTVIDQKRAELDAEKTSEDNAT